MMFNPQLRCITCRDTKPRHAYWDNPKMRSGKFSECIDCSRARNRKWHDENPKRRRELNIYSNAVRQGVKHNDIIAWYDHQLVKQDGKCGMPGCVVMAVDHKHGRLWIDHDHSTGRPRALLCNACNTALGYYEMQKENFSRFEAYLEEN